MVELLMRNVLIVPMTANAPIPIAITVVSVVLQYFNKVVSVRLVMLGYMPAISVATVWTAPKFVIRNAMLLFIDIAYLFAVFIKENVSVFMGTACGGDALHTVRYDERECENEGYEFSCFHDDVPPVFSSVVVCGRVTYRGYMLGTRARTTQTIGLSSDPLRDNLRLWSKIYHYQSVLIIQ